MYQPSNFDYTILIQIVISIVAGFIVGVERESRGKDAGISTNSFVILGAALFTSLSLLANPEDPTRIAAQIVTGIGFLGAGLIMKDGVVVKNLTTAASLWFSGAIGMAIGFGYYFVALAAVIASIVIPRIPHLTQHAPEALHFNHLKKDIVKVIRKLKK